MKKYSICALPVAALLLTLSAQASATNFSANYTQPGALGHAWQTDSSGLIYAKGALDSCFLDPGDSSIQFIGNTALGSSCPSYIVGVGSGWIMPLSATPSFSFSPTEYLLVGVSGRYDSGGCGIANVAVNTYDLRGVFYDQSIASCVGGVLSGSNSLGSGYFSVGFNVQMTVGGHAYAWAFASPGSAGRQAKISQVQYQFAD